MVDAVEAVHTTLGIFGPELAGLLGVSVELLGTLAMAALPFLAIGAPYVEAWADISRDRTQLGFAYGVVAGADRHPWSFVKRVFWRTSPDWNAADQHAGVVAQKAFNLGLASGFIQGRQVARNRNKWRFFWQSIVKASDPADYQIYSADKKSWSDRQWYDYYIGIMAIFTRLYLKS